MKPDPKPAPDPYYLSKISKNVREKYQHFIIFNDLLPQFDNIFLSMTKKCRSGSVINLLNPDPDA
jgi:hypothetical protein